jgi:hypothetical protein
MEGAVRSGHRAAVVLRQALAGRRSPVLEAVPARAARRPVVARRPNALEVPA